MKMLLLGLAVGFVGLQAQASVINCSNIGKTVFVEINLAKNKGSVADEAEERSFQIVNIRRHYDKASKVTQTVYTLEKNFDVVVNFKSGAKKGNAQLYNFSNGHPKQADSHDNLEECSK